MLFTGLAITTLVIVIHGGSVIKHDFVIILGFVYKRLENCTLNTKEEPDSGQAHEFGIWTLGHGF